jgi:hypothetical protein
MVSITWNVKLLPYLCHDCVNMFSLRNACLILIIVFGVLRQVHL